MVNIEQHDCAILLIIIQLHCLDDIVMENITFTILIKVADEHKKI